jgi:Na+/melibiose symporter-like transporter
MSNIITSLGVFLILVAFFGNVTDKLAKKKVYFWLNAIGSILAGIGAFLVQLWPMVVLELIWAIVSLCEIVLIYKYKKITK